MKLPKIKLPNLLKRKKSADDAEAEDKEAVEEKAEEDAEDEGKPAKKKKKGFKLSLKLPGFLKRKKAKDGDEEEEEAEAEKETEEEGEEGEEGGKAKKGLDRKKRILLIAASAGVLLLGVAGGASWWLFAGDSGAKKAAAEAAKADKAKGPRAMVALPPRPGSLNTLVAPAPGQRFPGQAAPSAAPGAPAQSTPGAPPAAKLSGAKLASKSGNVGGAFGGAVDPLGGSLNAVGGAVDQGAGIVVPSVTSTTVARLPDQPTPQPLAGTPDARLVEEKKKDHPAQLPRIGKDGTMAWQLYARPNKVEEGPRVAILMLDVGLSRAASVAAITKLPSEVTMVLDPYARDLSDWVVRSRLAGHEVMLAMPMESDRFPVQDAGPLSLDSSLSVDDNIKRLELLLAQVTGYTGVATMMGSRFATSEALLTPVLEALKGRGLMLASTGPQATVATPKVAAKVGIPRVMVDITLDDDPSRLAVEGKLAQLEELIRQRQVAVAAAHPHPSTVERLINWTNTIKANKVTLVPASALAKLSAKPKTE